MELAFPTHPQDGFCAVPLLSFLKIIPGYFGSYTRVIFGSLASLKTAMDPHAKLLARLRHMVSMQATNGQGPESKM